MVFGKDNTDRDQSNEIILYMGKNVEIKGNISFEGSGRIDGKIEGKVTVKGSLILGEDARVSSEIEGDTVVVGGEVHGKIVGHHKVHLLKTSVINGDIITPSLLIEEGGQLNGNCRMSNNNGSVASIRRKDKEEQKSTPVAV